MTTENPPETNAAVLLAGILKNAGEGQPGTADRTKAIGENEVATKLAHLMHGDVSVSQLVVLMHKHGPSEVESAVKFVIGKNSVNKITNLGAFLSSTLQGSWHKQETSPRTQNRPSWGNRTTSGTQQTGSGQESHSSDGLSQENVIDILRKRNSWPLSENKQFYLKLDSDMRGLVIGDVFYKWPYMEELADRESIDLWSDDFIESIWFKPFADVVNDIRLDIASRELRTYHAPP